jgi:hypothetical protein
MAKKVLPITLDAKGMLNPKLVALVKKLHKKTPQTQVPQILMDAGYTTTLGGPITVDTVRKFETRLGLQSRRPELLTMR